MASTVVVPISHISGKFLETSHQDFLARLKNWKLAINEEGNWIDLDAQLFVPVSILHDVLYTDFDREFTREYVTQFLNIMSRACIKIIADPKLTNKLIFMPKPKKWMR